MTPVVSVVLTHHLDENRPYLSACLRAIACSDYAPFEVICISSAETPVQDLGELVSSFRAPEVHYFHKPELNTATKKADWATSVACSKDAKYYLFLSDDVMVSRSLISGLVMAADGKEIILNPFCNGDNHSVYETDIRLTWDDKTLEIGPNCDLAEIDGFEQAVIEFPVGRRILFPVPRVSFYCTLIPTHVYKRVGRLDPRLDLRHNDDDYCFRALRLGIQPMIHLGVFALHFGSKTLYKAHSKAEMDECSRVFYEKWGIANSNHPPL